MSVRNKEGHREKQVEKKKNQTPNKGHINKINPNHFKKKRKTKLNHKTKCMGILNKITVKNFLYSEGKDFRDGF